MCSSDLMKMDKGLDSGPVLKRVVTPILPEDNSLTLGTRLCALGCAALCEGLGDLPLLLSQAREQDEALVSYARKVSKAEALIDWKQSAATVHNLVRAMYPRAPAYCLIKQKRVRIIESRVRDEVSSASAGSIIRCNHDSIDVACGAGVLQVLRIQLEGKNEMNIASLLNGHPDYFTAGMQLDRS